MNATFRGAKGDYVLELTNRAKKGSQRTKAGIYFGLATKNAKKAPGELVQFLLPSRSSRLRGESLKLIDLLLARGLVLVRLTLPNVPAPAGINSNFHREDAKNAKKVGELVHFLLPSRLRGEIESASISCSRARWFLCA
jgi:hypothetical protein